MNGRYFYYLLSTKGLKRADVAKELEIHVATLNKKIKGEIRISVEEAVKIMNLLQMEFNDIFIDAKKV